MNHYYLKIISLTFYLVILSHNNIISQSGNAKSLIKGNKWVYFYDAGTNSYYYTVEVIGDTILNNNEYAIVYYNLPWTVYERADSLKIYNFNPSNYTETVIVDFSLNVGDSLNSLLVTNKDSIFIWERWLKEICLQYYFPGLLYYTDCYTEWIGETSGSGGGHGGPDYTVTLEAALIEGSIYGDTTLLGIDYQEITMPTDFKIFQNYPNPFNPTTNIIFEIPTPGIVKMRIYDLLGHLMEIINYGYKNAGKYKVNFDGSNYTSGVYFYQIQYENKIKTIKMLLLK